MVACSKYTCGTRRQKGVMVPYHNFPSESGDRREHWINFCDQPVRVLTHLPRDRQDIPWTPSTSSRLCGRHFTANDYIDHCKLKPGTVPTIEGDIVQEIWRQAARVHTSVARTRRKLEKELEDNWRRSVTAKRPPESQLSRPSTSTTIDDDQTQTEHPRPSTSKAVVFKESVDVLPAGRTLRCTPERSRRLCPSPVVSVTPQKEGFRMDAWMKEVLGNSTPPLNMDEWDKGIRRTACRQIAAVETVKTTSGEPAASPTPTQVADVEGTSHIVLDHAAPEESRDLSRVSEDGERRQGQQSERRTGQASEDLVSNMMKQPPSDILHVVVMREDRDETQTREKQQRAESAAGGETRKKKKVPTATLR